MYIHISLSLYIYVYTYTYVCIIYIYIYIYIYQQHTMTHSKTKQGTPRSSRRLETTSPPWTSRSSKASARSPATTTSSGSYITHCIILYSIILCYIMFYCSTFYAIIL